MGWDFSVGLQGEAANVGVARRIRVADAEAGLESQVQRAIGVEPGIGLRA